MVQKKQRAVTISGQNGYVALDEDEKRAYEVRFYYTSLTTQASQAVNREWFPERKFYGRIAFAQEEFVVEEVLINFNNQLLARYHSPELKLLTELQCMHIEKQRWQTETFRAMLSLMLIDAVNNPTSLPLTIARANEIKAGLAILEPGGEGSLSASQTLSLFRLYGPRKAVRFPLDGFYYSMANYASGQIIVQSWAFDEQCKIPGTDILATEDIQGRPPASAGGGDEAGGPGSTPPPSGNSPPPEPGGPRPPSKEDPQDSPFPVKPGQTPESTRAGRLYEIEFTATQFGVTERTRSTTYGPISGWQTINEGTVGGKRAFFTKGIDVSGTQGVGAQRFWNVQNPGTEATGLSVRIIRRIQ